MKDTKELINQMRQKLNRGDNHFGKNQVLELIESFEAELKDLAELVGALEKRDAARVEVKLNQNVKDKLFITEILNDLHRNGHIPCGKAETMLRDWARELREKVCPKVFPATRLRKVHAETCGKENW